jgi:hypothetical protein
MHFDVVSTDKDDRPKNVIPGVFKFDGPRLVLAYPIVRWVKWSATGESKERPQDFERRPGVVIAYLERCEHLEQSSVPEQIPKRP